MSAEDYDDDIKQCKDLIRINNELVKNSYQTKLIVLSPQENETIQDLNPKQYQNFIRYMREYYPFKIAYIKAKQK